MMAQKKADIAKMETRERQLGNVLEIMVMDEKTLGHCLESGTHKDLSQSSLKQMQEVIRQRIEKKRQDIARKEALIQHVYSFERCRQIAEAQAEI